MKILVTDCNESDQFGTSTSTYELAKMIEYLLPTDNYETFHGSCNWTEFASSLSLNVYKINDII